MKNIPGYLCIFALGLIFCGCSGDSRPVAASVAAPTAEPSEPVEIAIPVEAEKPVRGDISSYFETNARVVAERRVDVTSEGVGKCIAVKAEEGDRVEKGQILAELEKREALASLNQAEVQVRQQKAAYDRARMMWQEGLGPEVEYENAKFAYEQALASYELQQAQLDNLTIKAPIGGIVTRREIQVGTLVTSGTPAFSIVDPTSYILEIHPPERDLARIQVGQTARVRIDAVPDREFRTTVRRINPAVENGTVRATLDFEPEDREHLKEGAFARVSLVMDTHENALLLPKDAVLDENGREYVFVIEPAEEPDDFRSDGAEPRWVARRVDVETGFETPEVVEILSGIDDDSRVVTLGQHTLRSGAEVRLTRSEAEVAQTQDMSPEEALAAAERKRAEGKEPAAGRQ